MDANYPYSSSGWDTGYTYPSSTNFTDGQFQMNLHHQQQPTHPQTQQYYQPPSTYPQPQSQPYPQYYHDRTPTQFYQGQFQQPPPRFYQQPSQPQQQPASALPESTIEVVIPRYAYQTAQSQSQQPRQSRAGYQPESQSHPYFQDPRLQPQTSSPACQPPPPQQRVASLAQPPQPSSRQLNHPAVVVDIPSLKMPSNQPTKDSGRRISSHKATAPTMPQKPPPQSQSRVLQTVEVNTKPSITTAKTTFPNNPPSPPEEPEPDYPSLLCVLADDYLDEARKQPLLNERYYNLVSKALGCLESVLVNFKLPPLKEAQITLYYAGILYAETKNHDEAETFLTKAIELCDRHKFLDLKYEMQLLLTKILYESRPKAALRESQRMIEDIEAYRHTVWLYIFRFQHAMFLLSSSAPGDVHSAIVQLEKIGTLAKQNSDAAVLAFAATIETFLHLSSFNQEATMAAQTSLAKARAMQLNPDVTSNPQMTVLMEFIDLACSVREADMAQKETKRKIMQDELFKATESDDWRDDGALYIPVSNRAMAGIQLQANKHIITNNARHYITFSWLSKDEVEVLGYLLSAESVAYKNGADGGKAEKIAEAGLSMVRAWSKPGFQEGYRQSHKSTTFQSLLEAEFLLFLCFMRCSRGQWQAAEEFLNQARAICDDESDQVPVNMRYAILYLRGVTLQGTGNLTAALETYQSPLLNLSTQQQSSSSDITTISVITSSHYAESDITRNFSILAAMNSAFIIQAPNHPQHNHLSPLIKTIDAAVKTCHNKYIQAHFSLLISALTGTTLTLKKYLSSAMEAGKAIGSAQTTALALIYMSERLFTRQVGEKPLKCARAASAQTKRWGDPMWMHVTAGLEAQSLEVNGFEEEAESKKVEAQAGWEALPQMIKNGTA